MYICNECEEVFEEPICQDSDIQEAERCEECGQYVAELGDGLCEACYCGIEG